MIGIYLFFKMTFILVAALFWLLVWTGVALFWIGYAVIVASYWIIVGLAYVISFLIMFVKAVIENRRERQLINA